MISQSNREAVRLRTESFCEASSEQSSWLHHCRINLDDRTSYRTPRLLLSELSSCLHVSAGHLRVT